MQGWSGQILSGSNCSKCPNHLDIAFEQLAGLIDRFMPYLRWCHRKGSLTYDAISSLVTNLKLVYAILRHKVRSKYNQMVVIRQIEYIPFVGK